MPHVLWACYGSDLGDRYGLASNAHPATLRRALKSPMENSKSDPRTLTEHSLTSPVCGCQIVKLVRPPTAADWTTFRRLSTRVRNLRLDLRGCCRSLDHNDFNHIALLLDQEPTYLFPNLRSLTLLDDNAGFHLTRLAKKEQNKMVGWFRDLIRVGPTVLALPYHLLPSNVPDLPAIKSIRKLNITGSPSISEAGALQKLTLCETIPQLTSLESFSYNIRSWDVLWHLGRLPALRELSIGLPKRPTSSNRPHRKDGAFFSQLKFLHICYGTRVSITDLFRCSNFNKLTTFSSKPLYEYCDTIETKVLNLIPRHCRQLQSLCLADIRLGPDILKLDPYRNLRVLIITSYNRMGFVRREDNDFVCMIHGLPHLERFYAVLDEPLDVEDSWLGVTFTIRALVNLVEGCSKLEHIFMEFDPIEWIQREYISEREKGHIVRNDSVRHLSVSKSPATSPERLAVILSELLPSLEVITAKANSEHVSSWKGVAARHTNSPLFRSQTGDGIPRIRGTYYTGMTLCTLESLGL